METIEPPTDPNQWTPLIGPEVESLKEYLKWDATALDRLENETIQVMKFCGSPHSERHSETGLVIGYVQSGKTVSFTTLTAMAKDNGYQIIILIAGTSRILVDQSTQRLINDLRLNQRNDRVWSVLTNPKSEEDRNSIASYLAQWRDTSWFGTKRTVLITVMKNGSHLNNLIRLLESLNLDQVPTLIIDDEGDQASLNTRARANSRQGILSEAELSTIYRRITRLKAILPHHTFLQYTATPQAPLFINIMDRLSPNFIKLLTPGEAYTGGKSFFLDNPNLIQVIPDSEVFTNDNILTEPPSSLLEAMMIFFLGVASGLPGNDNGNRSMMLHPSRTTDEHQYFFNWVNTIKNTWVETLSEAGPDKTTLLEEFRVRYQTLLETVDQLESFDILAERLMHSIRFTQVIQVNSRRGRTPSIPWRDHYSFILVGGQSLDRGFTVEGLTVTYMPRSLGTGNADTLQQRARFFGYKMDYIGFCRVYLHRITRSGYQEYVEHEEDIRNKLGEHDLANKHLNVWDRRLVLDQLLNLCRGNIISEDLNRDRFGEEWVTMKAPHDSDSIIDNNRDVIQEFIDHYQTSWAEDQGHIDRTIEQRHQVISIPVHECYNLLLEKLRFTRDSDSGSFTSMKSVIRMYLAEDPTALCEVYLMSVSDTSDWSPRLRRLNQYDKVQQLFQGRNPKRGIPVYPGDRNIGDRTNLIFQIHNLDLKMEDQIVHTNVIGLATWIPDEIGKDMIRQNENGGGS